MMLSYLQQRLRGFSFIEVILTMSLFLILAGVGIGAYFKYYHFSLLTMDVNKTMAFIKETRFRAQKNATNSDYGVHLDPATRALIRFANSYSASDPSNISMVLEQLDILSMDLQPAPGVTDEIIFENQTGKTLNHGSFTIGTADYQKIFTINPQGVVE
ncbi:prepilin-type N-terminal cleavage/methylation domain-containing protein [Candidatus Peregrinibacteria bacterium]|nr:prepilin-type N-terminal cleavage/methylation domain-containing protein [Candidatus Peregrinibacteria bacterium]